MSPRTKVGLAIASAAIASSAVMAASEGISPALQRMHTEFVAAFVNSEGFGQARITPMMHLMHQYEFEAIGDDGLCVGNIELVGIAKHDPPVAYRGGFTGFQHSGPEVPLPLRALAPADMTRALTAAERQALAILEAGPQNLVRTQAADMQLLGAIRAQPECLACHKNKKEGDLLGALSYRMGRLQVPDGNQERRYCNWRPAPVQGR